MPTRLRPRPKWLLLPVPRLRQRMLGPRQTAADTAADLAEAASMKAQDATDSATAMTEQMEAEAQRNVAQSGAHDGAGQQGRGAKDARLAAEQVQEERDLANAKAAAQALFVDADGRCGLPLQRGGGEGRSGRYAGDSRTERCQHRANSARTDYANAKKQADAAKRLRMRRRPRWLVQ